MYQAIVTAAGQLQVVVGKGNGSDRLLAGRCCLLCGFQIGLRLLEPAASPASCADLAVGTASAARLAAALAATSAWSEAIFEVSACLRAASASAAALVLAATASAAALIFAGDSETAFSAATLASFSSVDFGDHFGRGLFAGRLRVGQEFVLWRLRRLRLSPVQPFR